MSDQQNNQGESMSDEQNWPATNHRDALNKHNALAADLAGVMAPPGESGRTHRKRRDHLIWAMFVVLAIGQGVIVYLAMGTQ